MEQGTLGKRIAYHRKRLGMTQEQLAQRVGVSAQAVSKWENNLSCPDITILPELASIFGISVDELLGRTPPKEERVHEAEVIKPEEKEHILDYTIGSAARSGLWFAIYVLAIGALFLVNALGKFDVSVWTILWTSALLRCGQACSDRPAAGRSEHADAPLLLLQHRPDARGRLFATDRIRLSVHRLPLERPDPGLSAAVGREPAGRLFLRPQAEAAPCARLLRREIHAGHALR